MRNIKLLIEYDGTNYVGWQRQASPKDGVPDLARSIQGEIESALRQVLQENVSLNGAGRTDAGVHARGQVANFRSETKLNHREVKGGLNALLPEDITVHEVEEVPLEFHARYSAKERQYSYLIMRSPSALMRHYGWHVKYSLNAEPMKHAASAIVGTHDFESFCKANSDVDHHRCTVTSALWSEDDDLLRFTIGADRFLHGMVRALVGSMVDVGRGYTSFDEFSLILGKKDRKEAGMAAPAKGLVLEKVIY